MMVCIILFSTSWFLKLGCLFVVLQFIPFKRHFYFCILELPISILYKDRGSVSPSAPFPLEITTASLEPSIFKFAFECTIALLNFLCILTL